MILNVELLRNYVLSILLNKLVYLGKLFGGIRN
ncbi:hypothetical protein P608_21970 [Comamonas thiooxydans]|uniref:Uncharacterized protein n=1 Tax=Comamonas thiooxydans TaxID=363952 RepID=A0A0E3BP44_9BURK|nr:hypothetical protein P608_21970 [Comamonas thiooxydans]KGH20047.1 hypothetical protein P607_10260 [Comamonas thiooxydans]